MRFPHRLFTRLTLLFALALVVTFAAVIALTLFFADRAFQSSIDDTIHGVALTLEERLGATTDAQKAVDELSTGAQFLVVLDAEGHVVTRSSNLASESLPPPVSAGPAKRSDGYHTSRFRRTQVRTIRHALLNDGQVTGYVVVGNLVPRVDDRLVQLSGILVATAIVGVALGTAGSAWFVNREVRPLRSHAGEARATAASNFERPIPPEGEGSSEEVRDLRRALSSLVDGQRQLLARERAFFADSSHVLRTPLAVLQGDIEMLEQGVYGSERAQTVAQARASIESMSRTVSGLLLLSREQEERALAWEALELGPFLAVLMADAQTAFPNLALTTSAAPGLDIAGDRTQLRALFVSLVENACRYTPPGGGVTLTAAPHLGDALVEIRDTGVGIAEEEREHLFERFYRGQAARRMFPAGSGLGLAIARQVVRGHNGTLRLAPSADGGTVAEITLPLLS